MAEFTRLKELEDRKRLLVAQSDVLRLTMVLEFQRLEPVATRIDQGYLLFQKIRPALTFLAPVAGFFAVRKRKTIGGVLTKTATAVSLLRRGLEFARRYYER